MSGVTAAVGGANGTNGASASAAKIWLQAAIAMGFAPAAYFFM